MWHRQNLSRFRLQRIHNSNKSKIFPRFRVHRIYIAMKSRIRRRALGKDLNLHVLGLDCDKDGVLGKRKPKKKRISTSRNVDEVTKKRRLAEEDEVSDQNIVMDRISTLPDEIIHHIFSFISCTKDVVRTTILSKRWKTVFDSYLRFDFDQRLFRICKGKDWRYLIEERDLQRNKFIEYVDRCVATRLARAESIDKFRFHADDVDFLLMACCLRSISAAKAKNVKELDIQVNGYKRMLPITLTVSSSVTFLKLAVYSLHGLEFYGKSSLRVISIKDSKFLDVNILKTIEQKCPLLEDLRLINCSRLSHVEISSLLKIKRVEIQDCVGVRSIKIAASNLETFLYQAYHGCKVDLKGSENLRNLTLMDRLMRESSFNDLISLFPLLEKLVLHNCNKMKKLQVCSLTLKSLTLMECLKLKEVDINAPNLYSFQYNGRVMDFPFIRSCSHLSEAKFSLFSYVDYNRWTLIPKYENFFENFDGSKGFKLIVYTKQDMKIFGEPREADILKLDQFTIELTASSYKLIKIVDNWLRESHGKSLELVSPSGDLIKLVNTLLIDREANPSCCSLYSNKCWRHHIEDVKVSTSETGDNTCFDFTWRPGKRNGQI